MNILPEAWKLGELWISLGWEAGRSDLSPLCHRPVRVTRYLAKLNIRDLQRWASTLLKNLQIRKFLGLYRYWKSANFLGVPVRMSQIRQFLWWIRKIANPQISTKYCTTLYQNSPKRRLFSIFLYKFELNHYMLIVRRNSMYLRTCRGFTCSQKRRFAIKSAKSKICGLSNFGTYSEPHTFGILRNCKSSNFHTCTRLIC